MKIELTPIRELRPYLNNARTHSRRQIRQIARSIEKFGFCNPVLIDDAKQIIAGHGRVAAAQLLGLDAVPTCRLSHLSDAEKRAYILADNRLAEKAGWDKELLAVIGAFLRGEGLEQLADCRAEGFEGARGGFSQQVFELGKHLLDGVQVRGIFRQEEQLGAGCANELADGFAFVAAEIVHDHDVAGFQGGDENLLDIGPEALAIDRAVENPWSSIRSWRRAARKVVVRHRRCGTLAWRRMPRGAHPRSGAMWSADACPEEVVTECTAMRD